MAHTLRQYEVVRVVSIRENRFAQAKVLYERSPAVGDTGTILEVYSVPSAATRSSAQTPLPELRFG